MDPLRFSDGWLFSQTQSVEQNKLVRAAYVHQSTGNVLLHYMYQRSLQRARWKAFTVIYIYITGMVLDTTRMGGENKNPRKHCRHRSFEEKEEEKKFNNQGFGVAVWHASAAVHVCRMPSILFVTLDENGVCSSATESTTAEICIVLLTSKCATLFKLYSNAIHSAQIRLARFINAANHQIPL